MYEKFISPQFPSDNVELANGSNGFFRNSYSTFMCIANCNLEWLKIKIRPSELDDITTLGIISLLQAGNRTITLNFQPFLWEWTIVNKNMAKMNKLKIGSFSYKVQTIYKNHMYPFLAFFLSF